MNWKGSARAVSVLTGGTLLGQMFLVAASPLLTRLYSPKAFGTGATAASAIAILAAVSCCAADQMIHSTVVAEERARLARTGLLANGVVASSALAVGLAMFGWRGAEELALVITVAMASYLTGLYLLGSQVAVFDGQFARIARRDIVHGTAQAGSQVALGLLHPGPASLTGGQVMARALGYAQVRQGLHALLSAAPGTVWGAASATRWRPLLIATLGLALTSVSLQAPVVLTSIWFDNEATAFVALSQRVLALPLAIVGTSVGQTFLHEMNARRRGPSASVYALGKKYALVLCIGGGVLGVTVAVFAPSVFAQVFGDQWRPAGEVARASAVAIGSQFVSSPLSVVLVPLGFARALTAIVAARTGLAVAVFAGTSAIGGGYLTAMFAYACVQLAVNLAVLLTTFESLRRLSQTSSETPRTL